MNASAATAAARLMAVCALAWSLPAAAGPGAPMERLQLTLDADGLAGQESATVAGAETWHAALLASQANDPLTMRTKEGAPAGPLVPSRTTLALLVAHSFTDRLALGIALPVVLHQSTGTIGADAGASDLWLGGKFRLLGTPASAGALTVTMALTVPASDGALLGDTGTTLKGGLIGGYRGETWRTQGSIGVQLRPTGMLLGLPITSELNASAGVVKRLWGDEAPTLEMGVTVLVSTALGEPFQRQTGGEVRGSLAWRLLPVLQLELGGGAGFGSAVGSAVGTPASRLFLTLHWSAS